MHINSIRIADIAEIRVSCEGRPTSFVGLHSFVNENSNGMFAGLERICLGLDAETRRLLVS